MSDPIPGMGAYQEQQQEPQFDTDRGADFAPPGDSSDLKQRLRDEKVRDVQLSKLLEEGNAEEAIHEKFTSLIGVVREEARESGAPTMEEDVSQNGQFDEFLQRKAEEQVRAETTQGEGRSDEQIQEEIAKRKEKLKKELTNDLVGLSDEILGKIDLETFLLAVIAGTYGESRGNVVKSGDGRTDGSKENEKDALEMLIKSPNRDKYLRFACVFSDYSTTYEEYDRSFAEKGVTYTVELLEKIQRDGHIKKFAEGLSFAMQESVDESSIIAKEGMSLIINALRMEKMSTQESVSPPEDNSV